MRLMGRYIDCLFLPPPSISCTKLLLIILVLVGSFLFCQRVAISADVDQTNQFEYQLENRADPFVPFISEKAAVSSVNMDEILDNVEPLTGMQLFEPGQLTLVALLIKGNEHIAMVEDFTGKGYAVTVGTKIGRRGVIKNIAPKSVIIEETAVTRAGKKTVTEVVMLLKKEGEK